MTAITPTPAGEGKTTTSVGLHDGLSRIGKKSIVCLREPSLGPCFGMKGGAAGGGVAVPGLVDARAAARRKLTLNRHRGVTGVGVDRDAAHGEFRAQPQSGAARAAQAVAEDDARSAALGRGYVLD